MSRSRRVRRECGLRATHHFEGPHGEEGVAVLAVGPGVPAGIFAFLQDKLLACEALAVIAHPSERRREGKGCQPHMRLFLTVLEIIKHACFKFQP